MLSQLGYQVLEASHVNEAIRIFEERKGAIDLILNDLIMPSMGGPQLIECLKPIYPNLKVLYMSGYSDDIIANHGVLNPEIEFIEKPFTLEKLAKKVRWILDYK